MKPIYSCLWLAMSAAILFSGCRMLMKESEKGCAEDGFVASSDTTFQCSLGEFSLSGLDTFVVSNGKGAVRRFKVDCQTHQLSPSTTQVVVGMESDAPPMFFVENGKETGFDYELLKDLLKQVFPNAQMKAKGAGYDELAGLMRSKQVDLIGGGYVADAELKGIDWTVPYLSFGYCLITNLGQAQNIKTLADLKGKRVGVYEDGESADWLQKAVPSIASIVQKVDDPNVNGSDWMKMLVNREVDAVVYDFPFAAKELADYRGELVITNKCLNAPNDLKAYAFGLPCGNTKLLIALNEAISKYKSTAQYANLVARFIPNPDEGKTTELPGDLKNSKNVYQVKAGETLSSIAQKELGSIDKYKDIYELNKDRLASPDIIYVGTLLKMPR